MLRRTIPLCYLANMAQQDNPEKSVKSWLEKMEEDLQTARDLLKSGRYTWCAFACQQFLEKYLKAAYVQQFKTVPPYTHSLLRLCKDLSLDLPENILDILATVDKYYLAARYPAYKENLNLNDRFSAETLFRKAQEAFEWLQSRLKLQRK